jgi:hypothetical protein
MRLIQRDLVLYMRLLRRVVAVSAGHLRIYADLLGR